MKKTGTPSLRKFCLILLMMLSYADTFVLAAPKGGQVVSGTATIQQNGNLTLITAGNHSIINYGSFNIAAGETVRFVQPGANSSVLNRVVGSASPTEIFGSLQANGHVFLINPYGIYFRNGSVINVGGLYAGAGKLDDADFTRGKIHFTDLAGDVQNDGIIAADNRIALLGANVINTGSLKANTGMAMMVSGKDVYVGEKNGNIFVQANGKPAAANAAATAGGGQATSSGSIVNGGTVAAPRILLGGGDLYSTAISNSGLLQGRSVAVNAGRNGTATVGGTLDASGATNRTGSGRGGSIQVLGGAVALQGATLDASGPAGGGSVRVGGDFHGGGALATSATTRVDAATTLRADATGPQGDGGSVVVWSDAATRFDGQASARGGTVGGNGGSAEVSSGNHLAYGGATDLRAPAGRIGSLLLDPHNITVATVGLDLPAAAVFNTAPGNDITISTATLATALGLAAVTLQANTDITVANNVAAGLSPGNLILQAGRSILISNNVTLTLGGALTVTFNDAAANAQYRDAGAAAFTMGAGSAITAAGGVTVTGGTLAQTGDGTTATASTIAANTGAVALTALTAPGAIISVTNNAAPGKAIAASGTLSTAANANNTAGGAVTLMASGALSTAAVTATGMGNGAGGVVSLLGGTTLGLNGAVNGLSLTTGAGVATFNDGGAATTSGGGQTYNGAVILAKATNPGQTTLTDTAGGAITFTGTVDGATAGTAQGLTLATGGVQTLAGAVGSGTPLATLATTGAGRVEVDGGVVNTSAAGGQSYAGPVVFGAVGTAPVTTLTATGGTVLFSGAVRSKAGGPAQALSIGAGTVTFGNTVGVTNPLASLALTGAPTTNLNGGSVTTSGAAGQSYTGPVTLGAGTTLTATGTGPVTFGSTVNGAQTLTVNAEGLTTFANTVGTTATPLTSVAVTGTGGTSLTGGGTVTTSDAQNFAGVLTLGLNAVLTSTGSTVTVGSLTGNAHDLTVNAAGSSIGVVTNGGNLVFADGAGVATFTGNVNATTLTSTGAGGTSLTGGGTLATSGLQNLAGPLNLGLNAVLTSTGSTVTVGSLTGNAHDLTVNAAGSSFGVIGTGGNLVCNLGAGVATFGGSVGATSLVRNGTGTTVFTAAGSVDTASAAVGQSYGGPVQLGGNLVLSDTQGGPITFTGAVVGASAGNQNLTVNTSGATTFGSTVGSVATPLASVTTSVGGTTTLNGGSVVTAGLQAYNDMLVLGTNTTLASPGGGDISLKGITGGGFTLAVNTGGVTTFGGPATGLGTLTTDAAGSTVLSAGGITTTGPQTYNDAVTVGADTTLAAGAGDVAFAQTLDSAAGGTRNLTITTSGTQTFSGAVGTATATSALASLTTGTGPVQINGGAVNTTGVQVYNGPLTLGSNLTLTTTNADPATGAVTFNASLGGAFGLTTATSGGNTIFGANSATGAAPLTALTTSASGSTIFNNAALTTNGPQTYQGAVVVQSATRALNLLATAGSILFGGPLTSTATLSTDLLVTTTGAASSVTFTGPVGSLTTVPDPTRALNSLTVSVPVAADSFINLNGGLVDTASASPRPAPGNANDGLQIYTGTVRLGANTTFVGTSITASGVINAQNHDLTLTLSGLVNVPPTGGFSNVNSFTSNGAGGTNLVGSFTTNGFQHYDNATTLAANVTLTSGAVAGQDSIRFGSTLDSAGGFTLNLNTPGPILFGGVVGGAGKLGSLTTVGGGINALNGGAITTFNGQSYGGPVVLGASGGQTTLTSTLGGEIDFVSTVNGNAVGTQSLTTATTGSVVFADTVGGTAALRGLTTGTGPAVINGAGVTTANGGQNYQGPLSFDGAAAVTLADTGTGNLRFGSTVDNFVGGTPSLTLSTGGGVTFVGAVGSLGALGNFVATATGGIAVNGGSVRSTGFQTYTSPAGLSLGVSTAFTSTVGGNITFATSVDGSGAGGQALTLNTTGNGLFNGLVGRLVPLASLLTDAGGQTQFNLAIGTAAQGVNVTGNVTINDAVLFAATGSALATPTIRTGGSQTYDVGGSATQNTALVGGGSLTSGGTLDFGGHDLGVRFGAPITVPGAFAGVQNFISDGTGGTLLNGTFTTTGTQTYGNAVTLAGTPVLNGVGTIIFNSTVDGNALLTLNVTGAGSQAIFNGLVGNGTTLLGLTSTTTGGTYFNVAANLATVGKGAVNVGAGGVTINGPVFFNSFNSTLTTADHPTVLSTGPQTYNGAATVQVGTALMAGAALVTFGSTLDGPGALAVSTAGNEVFNGLIGSLASLAGLTTDAVGTVGGEAQFNVNVGTAQAGVRVDGAVALNDNARFNFTGASLVQPGVLTLENGSQSYGGVVTLAGTTVFTSTAGQPTGSTFTDGGQIGFSGPITSAAGRQDLYVRTAAGQTRLFGSVDASSTDFGGAQAIFNGNVGPVGVFSVRPNSGGGGSISILGGSITTSGPQVYSDAVILGNTTVLTAGGNITFNGTVDSDFSASPRALTLNTGALTILNGLVGNGAALLSLTTDAGGGTQLNMNVGVAGALAGVRVVGAVTLNDAVLFNAAGSSPGVPTVWSGVQGGTGSQSYAGAATLGQGTVLTEGSGGNVSFGGTVNGGFGLSVNSGGDEIFNGLVGNLVPLESLQTDQVGTPGGFARFNMSLAAANTVAGVRVTGLVNVADGVVFNAAGNGGTLPTIQTGGAQTYQGAATVTQGTVLASTGGGNLAFLGTLNGSAALTLNTAGITRFNGVVGGVTPLSSLTTDAAGTTQLAGGFITTTGAQTYNDPVTLAAGTTLSSTGAGTIRFANTLDGNATLGVNTGGLTSFDAPVGGSTPLASLTTDKTGTTAINGGSIRTNGFQTYNDAVSLGANTTLASLKLGNITFNSTLDGNRSLAVNTGALTILNGLVGNGAALLSLTTDAGGGTQLNMNVGVAGALAGVRVVGAVTLNDAVLFNAAGSSPGVPTVWSGVQGGTGSQSYAGAVTLGQGTVLTEGSGGNVSFGGTVNGGFGLSVNSGGQTVFNGIVGGSTPLASLTTDAPGSSVLNAGRIITTGAQTYGDAVRLVTDTTLTSLGGGDLTFNSTVDGSLGQPFNGSLSLVLNSAGVTRFGGLVGGAAPLLDLTTDAPGSTFISGGCVTVLGAQTYNDPVVLGADTVLTSGVETRLGSTLNSDGPATPRGLTINSNQNTNFNGAVGGLNPLGGLTVNGGRLNLNGGGVTTLNNGVATGAQTYNGPVVLGNNAVLTSLSGGTGKTGGNLTFNSTVNGASALTLNTGGLTIFNGTVGNLTPLTSLTTDSVGAAGEATQFNLAVGTASGGVVVSGLVTINDAVFFNISGSSLTQPGILTLNNADQVYNGPVTLVASTYLTSTAALPATVGAFTGGGAVQFNSPVGIGSAGGQDLYVRSAVGATRFNSTINVGSLDLGGARATFNGPINLPGTLSVLPNDGGTGGAIEFTGGGLTTAGGQTYRVGIILGADTVFTSLNTAGDGGNIVFQGRVDSDSALTPRALTLNTSGDEIFRGLVGNGAPLASLTTDSSGPVGGTARFNLDLTGTPAGTAGVNVLGAVTINDAVRFNVAGSSLVDGTHPTILTGGGQTYNGPATLAAGTALVSKAVGALVFNSSVDGAFGLALSSGGDEIFNGLVGRTVPLASLVTDVAGLVAGQARLNVDTAGTGAGVNVAGTVTINDGVIFNAANVLLTAAGQPTVLTGGTQTYNGAAVLARDTVLSSNGGDVRFNNTLDGAFGLSTYGGGFHDFNGLVGSIAPLASLTTNGGGTRLNLNLAGSPALAGVRINGPLTVNGTVLFNVAGSSDARPSVLTLGTATQVYNGPATLAQDTVLAGSSGGTLLFASTVDGAFGLTLNTAGLTQFNGAVGGTAPLAFLSTNVGGTTFLGGGRVLTTGTQNYGDSVVLGNATTLTSNAGGDLLFRSDVNGAFDLALNTAGREVFSGPVGNLTPLLSLTTDLAEASAGGTTTFNFPATAGVASVRTVGAQLYHNGFVLGATTVLTSQNGAVTSTSMTGGGFDLSVNAATSTFGRIDNGGNLSFAVGGVSTFNGPVVGTSLTVSGGTQVALNVGSVTTSANQIYAEPVLLGLNTTLNAGGAVNVASLDGAAHSLTLSAASATFGTVARAGGLLWTIPGLTTLNGPVDAASLRIDGKGDVTINGGRITTAGNQLFSGKVTLGTNTLLQAGDGTVTAGSLIGNRNDLTVTAARAIFGQIDRGGALNFNVAGRTSLNGAVVARSLNVDGETLLNGGSVRTDGAQTYRGALTLGAAANLVSTGGLINARNVVAGNGHDLTVTAPMATFNRIDGTGAMRFTVNGLTTLNDAVDATSFTVGGGGTLALNAGRVTTAAFQSYAEPVALGGDTLLASSGAGDVNFATTLDGAQNLTVDTAGNAVFGGAVGGGTRLSSLTIATGGATINGGLVQTVGNQVYDGEVLVSTGDAAGTRLVSDRADMEFNRDVTGSNGSLFVQGHRVLMRGDTTINGGNLSLNAVERPGAASTSLLLLDGRNYVSNDGDVILNGADNLAQADLSTIVFTNTGTVNVRGSNFSVGYLQKVFAAGSLTIDVGRGIATVGDLAARQNLRINAREVLLLNRPPGLGNGQRPNQGLNFVADQSINFGNATLSYGRTENQTANFITTTGSVTIQRREGLSIFKDPNLDTQFRSAFTRAADGIFLVSNPFQPVGGGSQTLDTAAAISGALPDQKPLDLPVDVTITASQMEELRKLGIHPRKAQDRERGATSRQALFAQLVDGQDPDNYGRLQPVKGGINRLVPSDYVVVVDRMSEREVQAILKAFEALYGKNKEKAPEIGAAYQKAFDEYSAEKQTADPVGFAPYLKEKFGQYPAVDTAARGFDNLFGYIEHMGLTPVEITKAESYIVSDLNVSGPTADDMANVINAQRKALPAAQKAPSTKVPPAPPLSSPGPAISPAPTPEVKKTPSLQTAGQDDPQPARHAVQPFKAKAVPADAHRADLAGL